MDGVSKKGNTQMTKTFQIGQIYSTSSACDHECIFSFTVLSRTAKFVTLEDAHGRVRRVGVSDWEGVETCMPHGRYSMAAVLRAEPWK